MLMKEEKPEVSWREGRDDGSNVRLVRHTPYNNT